MIMQPPRTSRHNISTRLPVKSKRGGEKTVLATYLYMQNFVFKNEDI